MQTTDTIPDKDTLSACCTPKEAEAIRTYHYWRDRADFAHMRAALMPTDHNLQNARGVAKMEAYALRKFWSETE